MLAEIATCQVLENAICQVQADSSGHSATSGSQMGTQKLNATTVNREFVFYCGPKKYYGQFCMLQG